MIFELKKCSIEELKNIKKIISNKELLELINVELVNRENDFECMLRSEYGSDRLPDYNSENSMLYDQMLLEYKVSDFQFLSYEGFLGTGNNKNGDFNQFICGFTNIEFDEKWRCNLNYLNLVFNSEWFRVNYEGAYNTLNYVINSIYKEINNCGGAVCSKEDLFKDIFLRKEAVKDNFTKIVDEMWQLRDSVVGSRLSVGNHGLSKNRYKYGKKFSLSQNSLIEAIAYGCSLDELNNSNYKGAKRLIYVPMDKMNKK